MTLTLDLRTRKLLEEAAAWRLLGLLFECPTAGWRQQVAALAREVSDPALRSAAEHALEEASESLYHSLFGPGGPAAARELSYQDSLQGGYLLAELLGTYQAFAYRPLTREVPDHVSVEVGFLGYLRLKEAYALTCGEAEHAARTREAAEGFLKNHLAVLAEPLATGLAHSSVRYLACASEALVSRTGSAPKVPRPSGGEVALEDCTFDCSS